MYAIDGEAEIPEFTLDHLSGYEGARPVRVGNGAYRQEQHDVWGALLDSMYLHTKSRNHLDDRIWPIVKHQVETTMTKWREPDRGIWEIRGEPKHFTSSKLMCWVAADRGARLAEIRGELEHAARWQSAADEIQEDILENGVDERGVFTQHYDTDALDASLLLTVLTRFLPTDDERVVRTVLAIADELTEDGLVLRYRTDETDDGLSGEEGSFAICSFWLVSALVEIGEVRRARDLCDKLLSYASPLGLYAEEIDPRSGRHLGNFPQAFTHLALINAVMHVIRADQGLELGHLPAGPRAHPAAVAERLSCTPTVSVIATSSAPGSSTMLDNGVRSATPATARETPTQRGRTQAHRSTAAPVARARTRAPRRWPSSPGPVRPRRGSGRARHPARRRRRGAPRPC